MKILTGNIINLPAVILIMVLTYSCISTKSLYIEIPQKGQKELPESIQSLLIITRTVDTNYYDLNTDSLQKFFFQKGFNYDTIINDIRAVDTTLKAVGELLFESGRYDFVIPEERFLQPVRSEYISLEMDWDEIEELCETYQTDAVLSLDHFKTRVSAEYRKESFFDPFIDGFVNGYYAKMTVYYEALFRIYDPLNNKVVARDFLRDTIVWENTGSSTQQLFREFTPVKQALTEAGISCALDFSDKISTNWLIRRRDYFFKGHSDLKYGAQLVENDKWEQAMALWKNLAETTNSKSIRSKAELNLAVGYELNGQLDEAIQWALKSYETMYRPITYDYLIVLKRRKQLQ